jgi:folylpolyglutamate synthase
MFGCIVKPGDHVGVVEFGDVAGMPWVKSVETAHLLSVVQSMPGLGATRGFGRNLSEALEWASSASPANAVVIAGSLYLVSDVLRLKRGLSVQQENNITS